MSPVMTSDLGLVNNEYKGASQARVAEKLSNDKLVILY
jgi:hypothetical protein